MKKYNAFTLTMGDLPFDQRFSTMEESIWFIPDSLVTPTSINMFLLFSVILLLIITLSFYLLLNSRRIKIKELKIAQKKLALVLEAGSMSAWRYNIKDRMFYSLCNQTLSKEALSYDQFATGIHEEDVDAFHSFFKNLINGEIEKGEQLLRFCENPNEKHQWYATHCIAFKSEKNGQIHHIIGTQKNVTKEVCQQQELKESRSKLKLALNSANLYPWIYHIKEEYFISPHRETFNYRDYRLEEILALSHDEDTPEFHNQLNEVIIGEKEVLETNMRITFPGEKQRWFNFYGIVTEYEKSGKPKLITGVSRDVSDLKYIEELISLREKAEESNRLKKAFLENISHEIRTPLNAIVGFSNLIIEETDKKEQTKYIEIVEKNNELLLQLINDIVQLSLFESEKLELHYSNVDLHCLFTEIYKFFQFHIYGPVSLNYKTPDEKHFLFTDEKYLKQVLHNLLSNAYKFTPKGSIYFYYIPTEKGIEFHVKDTGRGISPEFLPCIFDHFTKSDIFEKGVGVGLSVCQMIVEHLGGKIGVNSEVSKGSDFWFFIPSVLS